VIRTNLSNGWLTSNSYTGTVNVLTAPNTYRALQRNEGSLIGTLPSSPAKWNEPTWTNLSIGTYNGNIRNGRTGARALNLPLVSSGAQPIDLIRLPQPNEDVSNPAVYGQRFYTQASVRILLADSAAEISNLPGVTPTAPVDLTTLKPGTSPPWYPIDATHPPIALSPAAPAQATGWGYWTFNNEPTVTGFIKIEIQLPTVPPTWQDVTQEVLGLGFTGRNLANAACVNPNPDAIIRIQRLRDDLYNIFGAGLPACGNGSTNPNHYAPNVLYDTREAIFRDTVPLAPNTTKAALGGVMHYVELDINNLGRWLTGAIPVGSNGPNSFDPNNSTANFSVYISDRRGNQVDPTVGINRKIGEYGFFDFVNPATGTPNGILDTGEDLDGDGVLRTYGGVPTLPNNLTGVAPVGGIVPSALALPTTYVSMQEARVNRPLFFRRALKIVNGSTISLGLCPNGVVCGLAIATENPAYLQGNYNAPGGNFNGANVAASIIADAITFLSNNWNDTRSFSSPYATGGRLATTSWYRAAIVSGKGVSFPQPAGTAQDFGTDGGMHNFLRFLENWGGQTLNYRGSIVSFYYNRQGVGTYKCCTTVYSPPTRGYNFEVNFLQTNILPPRTPIFRDVNILGFNQVIQPVP
jgi:hypothetical protein